MLTIMTTVLLASPTQRGVLRHYQTYTLQLSIIVRLWKQSLQTLWEAQQRKGRSFRLNKPPCELRMFQRLIYFH